MRRAVALVILGLALLTGCGKSEFSGHEQDLLSVLKDRGIEWGSNDRELIRNAWETCHLIEEGDGRYDEMMMEILQTTSLDASDADFLITSTTINLCPDQYLTLVQTTDHPIGPFPPFREDS